MGRRPKMMAGMPPLREWWRAKNRLAKERAIAEYERQAKMQDAREKRRPKCRCPAYPWPHRPGGGNCRWPDPPAHAWLSETGGNKSRGLRHRGLVKGLCQQYGLHPIKDRQRIERLMPRLYRAWCKRNWPLRWAQLKADGRLDSHGRLKGRGG